MKMKDRVTLQIQAMDEASRERLAELHTFAASHNIDISTPAGFEKAEDELHWEKQRQQLTKPKQQQPAVETMSERELLKLIHVRMATLRKQHPETPEIQLFEQAEKEEYAAAAQTQSDS